MQRIVVFRSIEITVRTAQTVRDELNSIVISKRIQSLEPLDGQGFYDLFADLCVHVTNSKGLPFDPTALSDSTPSEIHDAYECFLGAHKTLKKLWINACNEVDADDIDPATSPTKPGEDADPNS